MSNQTFDRTAAVAAFCANITDEELQQHADPVAYMISKAYTTGMQAAADGGIDMGLKGGAALMLCENFAGQFVGSGATNYLEILFHHKDLGDFTVTMQRTAGKTPGALRAEALTELADAEKQLAALRRSDAWKSTALERIATSCEIDHLQAAIDCAKAGLNPPGV